MFETCARENVQSVRLKMEDVLSEIKCLSSQYDLDEIKRGAQDALDFLGIQQGLVRDEPYKLREKCFAVLRKCLETKRAKFITLAISGLSKMVKDDRFHSNFEPTDDSKWLSSQLLQATHSFSSLPDDTQIDILKIFLNVAFSKYWTLNGRIIISILCLCMDAYESGNAALRAAAQAAASQTLHSFCDVLDEESEPSDKTAASFNELLPIMQFITSKIDEAESSGRCEHGVVFHLECMLTLCASLPQKVQGNQHLRTFLWQKLGPVLISVLGTPRVDKNIVTRSGSVEEEKGRGSGGLAAAPSFTNIHAKAVYSISNELIRLFGRFGSLRPVLESVFYRVLLYPPPEYRYDAIKSASELLGNPSRVLDMAGPLIEPGIGLQMSDMSLIRLIMDSLEESSNSKSRSLDVAILCCVSLLKSLQELCNGNYISNDRADIIRQMYPKIEDCDYEGPKTYQSLDRLPKLYREKMNEEDMHRTDRDSVTGGGVEKRSGSESSLGTDGPEEEVEDDNGDDFKDLDEETTLRSKITVNWSIDPKKIPVTLGTNERQHAKHFFGALHRLLPALLSLRSCIEVDQALQKFATEYCQGVVIEHPPTEWDIIINADGIYFATYAALTLDLALNRSNYYADPTNAVPMTEDDFVNEVQNCGVLVYLSGVWLRELYQAVVSTSLLRAHGYLPTNEKSEQHALINLLTDFQGMETYLQGGEMLSECWRLERARFKTEICVEAEAGMRLSRKILTCCWDSIFKLLSVPLTKEKRNLKTLKLKSLKFALNENRGKMGKETTAIALEGLLIAANLFSKLGLQDRCGHILELLTSASCPMKGDKKPHVLLLHNCITSVGRLTTAHALNMELIIGSGLELGSRCPSCWPHIFRCCVYVKKLERNYFSKPENRVFATPLKIIKKEGKPKENIHSGSDESSRSDEDTCVDVYSFLRKSEVSETVTQIISSRKTGFSSTDLLEPQETAKVICTLSQLVDKLFEDAAFTLNLKPLESFSRCLCIASHRQLFSQPAEEGNSKRNWWSKFTVDKNDVDGYLLLDSLGEVMIKCVNSGRPLIHLMRLWAIIGPYLTESATHKDVTIGRKAVKHIHDTISAYFNGHVEYSYFHVVESLFRPFENLLCLELCDTDVQDQIVNCLWEFVKSNYNEICSGWRPLFGTLRVTSSSPDTIFEILNIFLETNNSMVFCNAAIDFILCLLNQIRGYGDQSKKGTDHLLVSLYYLKRCESILSALFKTSRGLVFNFAHRIQVSEALLIDSNIPDLELIILDNVPDDLLMESKVSYAALHVDSIGSSLDAIDRPSGVLRVWFLLLEGLHSAAVSANPDVQPQLLDVLFADLTELPNTADPFFGLYCVNRFVLPTTQSWLRQLSKVYDSDYSGFKQSLGLLSELVGHYFRILIRSEHVELSLNLMLTQVMLVLAECCIHPVDTVARLGAACFRHILNTAGLHFTQDQWKIACLSLHKACDVTLTPIRQLTMAFSKGSQSFYGDTNQIKIAARSDATLRDIIHLKQLSQQVFLLDCQRDEIVTGQENEFMNERSYTFLLTVSEDVIVRIPVKTLVVALLSHQSLLQVVAGLLLHEAKYMVPSLANALFINCPSTKEFEENFPVNPNLPGFMRLMSTENIKVLLSCLDVAYHTALVFDSRPGLKFLVQKVASLERAANLYRQARAAWTMKTAILFEICLSYVRSSHLGADDVKRLLESSETESESDLKTYLKELRQHFDQLCSTYVDLVSNKDEAQKSLENVPDQLIFFLVACEDEDIPEVKKKYKPGDQGDKSEPKEPSRRPSFFSDFTKRLSKFSSSSGASDEDDVKKKKIAEEIKQEKEEDEEKEKENGGKTQKENESVGENLSHDSKQVSKVLKEYRKRKSEHLKSLEQPRTYPFNVPKPPESLIPPELEIQRRKSFLKDGEARRKIMSEMFVVVFDLLKQLNEEQFRIILPVFFNGIRTLTAHASDISLKEAVAELFHRVSLVFGFGSP